MTNLKRPAMIVDYTVAPPGPRKAALTVRRWVRHAAVTMVAVGATLTATTGTANAETADYCRMAQDYYEWSINKLQDATYAGNIPEMRFWLRVFADAEAEMFISNC
jgi:hypothetical protein